MGAERQVASLQTPVLFLCIQLLAYISFWLRPSRSSLSGSAPHTLHCLAPPLTLFAVWPFAPAAVGRCLADAHWFSGQY
eukprot:1146079-Pelagomonas_calceolata.AAC.6